MKLFYSLTPAVANLTGYASNVTGAGPWTPTTAVSGDGLAHLVTIRNDTANSHSGKTLTITGRDANGTAQSETLAAPGVSATVTSAKLYSYITTVAIDATIGADTFDIGWSAVATSWDILLNPEVDYLSVFEAIVGATINFDLEGTLSSKGDEAYSTTVWTNDANWTAKTATVAPTALALRWSRVRLYINSASGSPTIKLFARAPGL